MERHARTTDDQPRASLPHLVARQAAATPAAVAVVDGPRELTYAELDARSDRLARFLRLSGGRPDATVAICLPRGIDLVVALLGVWRAGLAYLPLDPDHPPERLEWQLSDAGARLIITDRFAAPRFGTADATVIRMDADRRRIAEETGAAPAPVAIDPDGAAYVTYTSGSTGRPKGVMVTHAGIANRVAWTVRQHRLCETDRVLQKTALTFDAAGWEIFAPLVSGGTVVLAPIGAERDPAAMVRAVREHRVTVLQVVPSVLRLLVDEPSWSGCESLRLVFSAGEPLRAELCQRLLKHVDVEIWNTYGPTECSIDVSAQRFDADQESGPVAIGRPIDDTRLLVLDAAGAPVPVGVPGELHIGGAGLARGYLGRPALTAERFVPDPYATTGSRLYRTGDLVRWQPDGTLMYLGRLDSQIKVNGVRIEPGEVEAALLRHPDIGSAVVKGCADAAGNTRLVAYLLRRDVARPEGLRDFLADHLPRPLIPAVFIVLDAYPTTSSGKVDRTALPDPETHGESGRARHRAPGTPAEELVAQVWSELLGVSDVGAADNFFQLGGSSLVLTRLASRLSVATGHEVTVPDLYYALTVSAQARLIEAAHPEAEPIRRVPRDRELPLSFGQQRQWFLDRMRPGTAQWVAPMVVTLPADLPPDVVQRALDALERRHEALRTRYVVTATGDPAQVVDEPGGVPLRVTRAPGGMPGLFAAEFARGFDLAAGRLVRATLVRDAGPEQTLLLTMHHIACDGWSTVVLERELRELCEAFRAGRPPHAEPPAVQYADFAVWQRQWLTEERLHRDLAYWRTALDGVTPLELPADRARPREFDPRGALAAFRVPAEVSDRLVRLGHQHGATPFMTFLTAYAALLSRYCGRDDVPIGVPVSGRVHPDVADTVGFFLNSLVLRCDVGGAPTFLEALDRVRGLSEAAFAHQSLPFERLVDDLVSERDAARTPLYQVEFDMHHEGLTGTSLDGAGMAAFRQAWSVTKTDLCLYLQQHDDGSMSGTIEYATALFDAATVERFIRHFTLLLGAIAADPDAPLAELDHLDAAERAGLLADVREPAAVTALYRAGVPFRGLPPAAAPAGAGVRVYVLDHHGAPAPAGVPGRVYLGGHLVTRGEVAGTALPPDRFVPDRFGPGDGLLYATGDLARRRGDGSVEALGPAGDPVRVLGYWVDTRLIEAVLREADGVDEAVVLATGDELLAYWTGDGGHDLAGHCHARLYPHQVPERFVRVPGIPRLPGGGVDREALTAAADAPADDRGPRTAAEQRIAEVWADLLDIAEADLDVHASFFGMGGNSILAIRVISTLREEFGVEVPVRVLFEEATAAKLARHVEEQIRAQLAGLGDDEVLAELMTPEQ